MGGYFQELPREMHVSRENKMPTLETVYVKYWTTCKKFGIPYPCRKTRTTQKWCYQFDTVRVFHWFVYCRYEGCEGGTLYKWSGPCFGSIGSSWVYNIRQCLKNKLSEEGNC
jgi:hypothetical protein